MQARFGTATVGTGVGVGFGLGAIMGEELTLTDGHIDQSNFDAYTPLRIDAMPKVEVHIVASAEAPTGVGEPGVPLRPRPMFHMPIKAVA